MLGTDPKAGARVLLESGVNVASRSPKGWTALMRAAKYGRTLSARALIANGANVNAVSKGGATPIMIAAERGKMEMVQLLIRHQAGYKREKPKWCQSIDQRLCRRA